MDTARGLVTSLEDTDLFGGGFGYLFVGVLGVILLVVVVGVISTVKRWRAAKDAGLDPLTADVQVLGRLHQSQMLAPPDTRATTEQRLAEVEDLHRRGVITDDERAGARRRILGAD